jgi:hypothetical protein
MHKKRLFVKTAFDVLQIERCRAMFQRPPL